MFLRVTWDGDRAVITNRESHNKCPPIGTKHSSIQALYVSVEFTQNIPHFYLSYEIVVGELGYVPSTFQTP